MSSSSSLCRQQRPQPSHSASHSPRSSAAKGFSQKAFCVVHGDASHGLLGRRNQGRRTGRYDDDRTWIAVARSALALARWRRRRRRRSQRLRRRGVPRGGARAGRRQGDRAGRRARLDAWSTIAAMTAMTPLHIVAAPARRDTGSASCSSKGADPNLADKRRRHAADHRRADRLRRRRRAAARRRAPRSTRPTARAKPR